MRDQLPCPYLIDRRSILRVVSITSNNIGRDLSMADAISI